jgi:hypothetical protein
METVVEVWEEAVMAEAEMVNRILVGVVEVPKEETAAQESSSSDTKSEHPR